jgi:hypothetical protein
MCEVKCTTEEEIGQLLEENRTYHLPEAILVREFSLGLIKADDPMFLLKVPQPYRAKVIEFGMSVTSEWYEISNIGTRDYSEHAPKLRELVECFLSEVPLGSHIQWHSAKST